MIVGLPKKIGCNDQIGKWVYFDRSPKKIRHLFGGFFIWACLVILPKVKLSITSIPLTS
ncbi:hypothetical protein M3204_06415 [Mesobacillus subterraneus]|uniref:hypothetical protein n=1 Tax=Mesobacillus subterraneus TaxID=285983 RepID=UPI00203C7151|nr:hypothetical protein [Mesobacillus subterraneus]MCM3664027.1 hypothetical protein [Mesobacillus subterraneus]MCM3685519.1 hypothetical protein [Mesobacillus subterraneus]